MVARSKTPASKAASDPAHDELRRTVELQAAQIAELQSQVEDLSQRRTLFLSSSAHELKTPLTVLQVYLETLVDELAAGLSEEQLSFINICHESVLRLRRLVLDLVDLAAIESGKVTLEIGEVDLDHVLDEVVVEMGPLARRAKLARNLETEDRLTVRADDIRLQQIVRNLVDNSVKNTPPGGTITVKARGKGDRVRISVIDDGIGIPKDRIDSVFEEFVRIHPTEGKEGTGLGLAICLRLTEAMDGRISVTSDGDTGTTFDVDLPAVPQSPN